MPHFVIEFSKELEEKHDINAVMKAAFDAGVASEEMSAASLKVRAIPIEYSYALKENATFVHTTVHLFEGRNAAQKDKIGQLLLDALTTIFTDVDSVSVDLKDMDKKSYKKKILD